MAKGWVLGIILLIGVVGTSAHPESLFIKGRALQRKGLYSGAARVYRAFLKEQPRSIPGLTNLGVVLAHEGNFEEAIDCYKAALDIDAKALPAKIDLGLAYYRMSDWSDAEVWFESVLHQRPENRRLRQLLAIALTQNHQYADAARAYQELLPSSDPSILIGLASVYRELGEEGQSERILTKVLDTSKNSPQVHYLLGLTEYARQDYKAACKSFQQMLKIAPNRVDGYFYLGASYFKERKFDKAIAVWKIATRIDQEYFPATFALGALLSERQRYDEAESYLTRALTERPNDPAAEIALGRLYLHQNLLQKALAILKNAVRADPKSEQASFLLATTYKHLGKAALAEAEFHRSKELLKANTASLVLSEAIHVQEEKGQ